MAEHYAKVNIFSAGAAYHGSNAGGAFIEGNGSAKSDDLPSLRSMSDELVSAVDNNNERIYKLIRK